MVLKINQVSASHFLLFVPVHHGPLWHHKRLLFLKSFQSVEHCSARTRMWFIFHSVLAWCQHHRPVGGAAAAHQPISRCLPAHGGRLPVENWLIRWGPDKFLITDHRCTASHHHVSFTVFALSAPWRPAPSQYSLSFQEPGGCLRLLQPNSSQMRVTLRARRRDAVLFVILHVAAGATSCAASWAPSVASEDFSPLVV